MSNNKIIFFCKEKIIQLLEWFLMYLLVRTDTSLVPKVGLYNPRRKNNLQDYFYLRFGRPQSCTKLGNLLFESHIKNQKQRNTEKICVSLFLVPKVGLEPTWFPARFWVVCVCQFRHIGIYVLRWQQGYYSKDKKKKQEKNRPRE